MVSWLPIVVAAIVSFLVGWLWYSPVLFGGVWIKATNMSKADMAKAKQKGMAKSAFFGFIAQLVMAWILGVFIFTTASFGVMGGVTVAFWVWLGFVATIGLGTVLWECKPATLFWINMTHWLVAMLIMGGIIGAWM